MVVNFNLVVVKTQDILKLKEQYECLGLDYKLHRHGTGPNHFSTIVNGVVFEIYPVPVTSLDELVHTRLGFEVENLGELLNNLQTTNWLVLSKPKFTKWGKRAVIQDLDGRKVELIEQPAT